MKKILFSFFILFFVFSCSDDNDPDSPNNNLPETPTIGADGGQVTSDDGKVKLIIPPGALTVGKQISIEKSTTTSPINDDVGTAIGDVYELSPSGLKFNKPVEVIINYSSFATEINTKKVLAAHWKNATDYEYLNIEKSGTDKVSFKIRSFSNVQLNKFVLEYTGIPDRNFEKALIDLEIDSDKKINRRVLNTDIENIPELYLDDLQIGDLTGVQGFINLEILVAYNNNLSEIDVSKNSKLWALVLGKNQFSSIDISKFFSLTFLGINKNNISTIDISKNLNLSSLDVARNELTQIDVSKNINLTGLNIGNNNISELDVSKNINLTGLNIGYTRISELDVSNNDKLVNLDISGIKFTSLDLSKNTELRVLSIFDNMFTEIDISNNLKLKSFYCDHNQISNLDLVKHIDLEVLSCNFNELEELDLSNNIKLKRVDCINNLLTRINIKNGHNSLIETTGDINKAFRADNNKPNLCIQVDNETDANNGAAPYNTWVKDATASYSENCN